MTEAPKDYAPDEVINVRLPRKDYELLREILVRENAYSWLGNRIRSFWVFVIAGGLLATFTLGEKLIGIFR